VLRTKTPLEYLCEVRWWCLCNGQRVALSCNIVTKITITYYIYRLQLRQRHFAPIKYHVHTQLSLDLILYSSHPPIVYYILILSFHIKFGFSGQTASTYSHVYKKPSIKFTKRHCPQINFRSKHFHVLYHPLSTAVTLQTYSPMKMKQSAPKRRHLNYRSRGTTRKKAYVIYRYYPSNLIIRQRFYR
jgi:hypothetical protein